MGHHTHLTLSEREDIMMMRRDGKGACEIARAIGRDKPTVSRELSRSSRARFYRASTAGAGSRSAASANGLPREYFPKGESLVRVGERRVQEVCDKLNRRSRKRLGFRTPYEVHYSKTLHLICRFRDGTHSVDRLSSYLS